MADEDPQPAAKAAPTLWTFAFAGYRPFALTVQQRVQIDSPPISASMLLLPSRGHAGGWRPVGRADGEESARAKSPETGAASRL